MRKILLFLLLVFCAGCANNTEGFQSSDVVMPNGNFQQQGAVAVDSFGFYNCNLETSTLSCSEKIDEVGTTLLEIPAKGATMINPTGNDIYFVLGEKEICVYHRKSKEMELLCQEESNITYMRLYQNKLYYISDFNLYVFDTVTKERTLLKKEKITSMDIYQDKIYVICPFGKGLNFTIYEMNLDGSSFQEKYTLEQSVNYLNVSEYGFYCLTLGGDLLSIQNGEVVLNEDVKKTKQFMLVDSNIIFFIDQDMCGISKLNVKTGNISQLVKGKKIHKFYVLGNHLVYADQEQLFYQEL